MPEPSGKTLGDFVSLTRGTTYKSRLLDQPGPVLLGLATIQRDGGFRRDSLRTYGGEAAPKLILEPGDLYVSLKDVTQSGDLLGAVARMPTDVDAGRLTQDTVKLELNGLPADYVYWVLRAPQYRAYCRSHAIGTTNLSLARDDFLAFPLPDPTPERRALVELLGALDDKIELNRRMNATLSATIRLLFRRLTAGDSIEGSAADLGQYVNGRNFTNDASGTGRMVIRIADLNSGPGASTVFSDAEAPDEHVARFGDVLFAWSGSLGVYRWYADDALINQHIFKVVPNGYPTWFVYQQLLQVLPFFREVAADKATTMGHIKRSHLIEAGVRIPARAALDAASKVIQPLDDRIAANERDSRTLAALRDALLPKLISGELRICDAEPAP